ncbi:MAG: hypothetical protein QXH42_05935 [Thermoplasmata archaeon]
MVDEEDFYYLREDKTGKEGINYEIDGEFFGIEGGGWQSYRPLQSLRRVIYLPGR